MSPYQDKMQVCINGHVITDRFNTSPTFRKKFCTECGERTITQCIYCSADIPGDIIYDSIIMIDTFERFAPKICANCGNKFPWFEKRQKAEEERKQMKLESEEKRIEENQSAVKKIEIKIEGHGNVLNLGSMTDNVISNTIKLTQIGDKEIAVALESLTKAISSTTELTDNEKQKYLEQLNTLSEEALKPEDKRLPKSVLQTIINYGLGTLGAAGNLAEVWNAWGATIKTFFLRL